MLFKSHVLDGLQAGTIDLAFRAWSRASVRQGSTLRSPIGVLRVESIDQVAASTIDDAAALRGGYASRDTLLKDLKLQAESTVFRIALSIVGPDERIALRETIPDVDNHRSIQARLDRFDRASQRGPWTRETLRLIQANPAVRATDLALKLDRETLIFKRQVRQLKELGLTESLGTGYRLSPRGESFLIFDSSSSD